MIKSLMYYTQEKIGFSESLEKYKNGVANTSFVQHGKKTYALQEFDFPFNIKINQNEKDVDIVSIGHDDFDGQLKHNVSAHPKVDRKTGDLFTFGYDLEQAHLRYTVINKNREVVSKMNIPLRSPRMIHDFAITENHVIFPDLPLEFKPDGVFKDKSIFLYNERKLARYGIMKRLNKS